MELHKLSLRDLAHQLDNKSISAAETVAYFLGRIKRYNSEIGAVVALDESLSIDLAKNVDQKRARGEHLPPLAGIPFLVKDLEDCAGFVTTNGSALFREAPPAKADSLMVERFRNAGAIPVGKTNTPEFGWKGTTENLIFAPTRNPYDTQRTSGGSSGGTAAAVAAGMIPFGTSSDGGGSIRIPAACCGIAGLKTSTGRVPIRGDDGPGWWEFTTNGPMARSFSDTAWLYDFCTGPHDDDMRSLPKEPSDWGVEILGRRKDVRVGITYDMGYWSTDTQIRHAVADAAAAMSDAGYQVTELPPLFSTPPALLWVKIVAAYHARALGHLLGTPEIDRIDPTLAGLVKRGASVTAREFLLALDEMWVLSAEFFRRTQGVDLVVSPTTAGLAPKIGEPGEIDGAPTVDWVSYTVLANMARTPAASVCIGLSTEGLPIGAQVIGKRFGEVEVLRLGHFLESHYGLQAPPAFSE